MCEWLDRRLLCSRYRKKPLNKQLINTLTFFSECPVSESNIDQLNDGEVKEIVLNAGQSYGGYLLTKVNLAGLTFVLQVKNNSTLNAYARRNCYASSEYHDADKLNIVPDSECKYYTFGTAANLFSPFLVTDSLHTIHLCFRSSLLWTGNHFPCSAGLLPFLER